MLQPKKLIPLLLITLLFSCKKDAFDYEAVSFKISSLNNITSYNITDNGKVVLQDDAPAQTNVTIGSKAYFQVSSSVKIAVGDQVTINVQGMPADGVLIDGQGKALAAHFSDGQWIGVFTAK